MSTSRYSESRESNPSDTEEAHSSSKRSRRVSNGRSKERSPSRSRSRSRGRYEKSKSRRSRSRERRRSRSRSPSSYEGARLHVGDIDEGVSKYELEREFEKYGTLLEVWIARSTPRFAFIVFKRQDDANDACSRIDGIKLGHKRIRVTHARPRAKFYGGGNGRGYGDQRCYQCGEVGHFSRNCMDSKFGYKRPPSRGRRSGSRTPSPYRGGSRRHRSRSTSRSKQSPARRRTSRSRERKQEPSRNRSSSS